MPKTKKQYLKEDLALKAIELCADLGWQHFRFQDLADEADLSLSEIAVHFDDKICILCAYGRYIDRKMLEEACEIDLSATPRERLFDVLMTRFDLINDQRAGVVSVLESFKSDPKQALISLPYLGRSMNWALEAAGMEANGLKGLLKVAGLKLIYLKALREWMHDDSPDMSKVMASLDKSLGQAENFAEKFGI